MVLHQINYILSLANYYLKYPTPDKILILGFFSKFLNVIILFCHKNPTLLIK